MKNQWPQETPLEYRLALPVAGPPLLAFGAELNSSFCLAAGGEARLFELGDDLGAPAARVRMEESIERVVHNAGASLLYCARDLHPDFASSRMAMSSGLIPVPIQHHHAHMASVMAEHGITETCLGVIFDGMGMGTDGGLWGGEFLLGDLADFERVGHLRPMAQPGGDAAALAPWRMALSLLYRAYGDDWPGHAARFASRHDMEKTRVLIRAMERGVNSPPTTSAGRLFDGVSSLLGLCDVNDAPARAAITLEAAAKDRDPIPLEMEVKKEGGSWILDPLPAVKRMVSSLEDGTDVGKLAAGFHLALALAAAELCEKVSRERDVKIAVLSGGVFQNRTLAPMTAERLESASFRVCQADRTRPHDGFLAYGQAAAASARLAKGDKNVSGHTGPVG